MTQKYQVKVSMKQAAIVETGIVLKQGDFGMQIEIEVLDFDATGTTPQIVFRKAMGAVESTTITVSSNKYTYTFKGTELDTPGKVFCDLKLKNSTTQRISTASFMFKVVADTLDGLAEESSSYSDTIAQIVGGFDGEIEGLGKSISLAKSGLSLFEDTQKVDLSRGNIVNGAYNPGSGTYDKNYKYRITTLSEVVFPYDITLTIASGFRIIPYLYRNGAWTAQGWKTGTYNISANDGFYFQIGRTTEDTSETADIISFLSKVAVSGNPELISLETGDARYLKSAEATTNYLKKADAKALYAPVADPQVNALVSGVFQDSNTEYITKGKWTRGVTNPNTHAISTDYQYRISLTDSVIYPYYAEFVIKSGFRFYPYLYQDNTWAGQGWKTGSWKLKENTAFYCQIARVTEDESEQADIKEFLSAIQVKGSFYDIKATDYDDLKKSLTFKYSDFEYGGCYNENNILVKRESNNDRIRSRQALSIPQSIRFISKKGSSIVYFFGMDASGQYIGNDTTGGDPGIYRKTFEGITWDKMCIIVKNNDFTTMPADISEYFELYFENDPYVKTGKQTLIYQFGGNSSGNNWCFVRTPDNYNQFRDRPYPFVICNHGNGWVMDGTIQKANWTKRTMYVPLDDEDYLRDPTEYNGTADESLWYSNPTIEALLGAGYVVCGCENYGDGLFGNDKCRAACVDFYNHMTKRYNVTDYCFMIGASNGAMTSLNAAYLLQGKVRAMVLQYPLTCLVNQYEHYQPHQAGIRAAYGINDPDITIADLTKAVATHDPLTVDVVDGKKVGVFPPTKLYYSPDDAIINYQYNALALAIMLDNSNKIVATQECSGEHGDHTHFAPSEYLAWFEKYR